MLETSNPFFFFFFFETYKKNIVSLSSTEFADRVVKVYRIENDRAYSSLNSKTGLYNFDPLKPHFYIVKMGFTGVYIIFLIFAQNKDCGYSSEPPRRGGSNEYPRSMF